MGSTAGRVALMPNAKAKELSETVLPDHEGDEVRLGDLWLERPAALVWLRHYG